MSEQSRKEYEDARSRLDRASRRQWTVFVLFLLVTIGAVVGFGVSDQINSRSQRARTQHELMLISRNLSGTRSIVSFIQKTESPASAAQEQALLANVEHCIIDESAHGNGLKASQFPFPVPPGCDLGKVIKQ